MSLSWLNCSPTPRCPLSPWGKSSHLDSQSPSQGGYRLPAQVRVSPPLPRALLHTTSFTLQWSHDLWHGDLSLNTCFSIHPNHQALCLANSDSSFKHHQRHSFLLEVFPKQARCQQNITLCSSYHGTCHTVGIACWTVGDCPFCGQGPHLSSNHTFPLPAQPSTW